MSLKHGKTSGAAASLVGKKRSREERDAQHSSAEAESAVDARSKKRKRDAAPAEDEEMQGIAAENDDATMTDEQRARDEAHKRESRVKQKELKKERQNRRPHAEVIAEAKLLWEKVRPSRGTGALTREKRTELVSRLIRLLQGHCLAFALKHDGARVIQWVLKLGAPADRELVFADLKGHFVELTRSTFAKHIMRTLLKLMKREHRNIIMAELRGHIRALARHRTACETLDILFSVHSNATQQAGMLAELYSSYYAKFPLPAAESSGGLATILLAHPEKRETILPYLGHSVMSAVEKGTMRHAINHVALGEFLHNASEKERAQMIADVTDVVPEILHTRPGARAAVAAVGFGSAKDRKAIIKALKTYVARAAVEEHGHLVLVKLLQVTDDTVTVRKALLKELTPVLPTLACDVYGSRILLFLLTGVHTRYFTPWQCAVLAFDPARSKKAADLIRAENAAALLPDLIALASQQTGVLLSSGPGSAVLLELVRFLHAGKADPSAIDSPAALAAVHAGLASAFWPLVSSAAAAGSAAGATSSAAAAPPHSSRRKTGRADTDTSDDGDGDGDGDEGKAAAASASAGVSESLLHSHAIGRALKHLIKESPGGALGSALLEAAAPVLAADPDPLLALIRSPATSFAVASLLDSDATRDSLVRLVRPHAAALIAAVSIPGNAGVGVLLGHAKLVDAAGPARLAAAVAKAKAAAEQNKAAAGAPAQGHVRRGADSAAPASTAPATAPATAASKAKARAAAVAASTTRRREPARGKL